MRRPVGVKWVLFSFCWTKVFLPPSLPLSPCFHPHSRGAICLRSVHVGRSRFSRCCHLLSDLWFCSCIVEPGLGDYHSHRNSFLCFCLFFFCNGFDFAFLF